MSKQKKRPAPRELNEEEKNIVVTVRHCARELDDLLQGARRKVQSNARIFAESAVSSLFRGIEAYADMYGKLKLKSRIALERLFERARDLDDMVDAQDAIEETEGCWRNFLCNVDREVEHSVTSVEDKSMHLKEVGDYVDLAEHILLDLRTDCVCSLEQIFSSYTCLLCVFQPAYLPDTAVSWRFSEISKVIADFRRFKFGFVVITWGPEQVVRDWSKQLSKRISYPILWDRENYFAPSFTFACGSSALWAPEMLDFCGCQREMHKRSVQPPPNEVDWLKWNRVGGEVVLCSPKVSRLMYKKEAEKRIGEEIKNPDLSPSNNTLKLPETNSSARICLLHRSANLADVCPSGSIYQAALTCHAISLGMSESDVMDDIRLHRRLATPPDPSRLQYETQTGMYYDPEIELYYDSKTGYFYDSSKSTYYYWSKDEHRYIPANALVQAQIAASHQAQITAIQVSAFRAVSEQAAAKAAAQKVAAQLAAIHAQKDEYASYAYATCVLSQEPDDVSVSLYGGASASIEQSLGHENSVSGSIKSSSNSLYPPGCPPPPGV